MHLENFQGEEEDEGSGEEEEETGESEDSDEEEESSEEESDENGIDLAAAVVSGGVAGSAVAAGALAAGLGGGDPESDGNDSDLSDNTRRIKQKERAQRKAAQGVDVVKGTSVKRKSGADMDPRLKSALADAMANAAGAKIAEKQRQMEELFGSVFESLDSDKGGTLDVDGELLQTMQKLGLEVLLKDLRIAMEQVVQRKHDQVERVGMFQKRLVWDYLFKEEFIKVMVLMSEPEAIKSQKRAEDELFSVFQEFDEDKSGSIDCDELGKAMEKMGRPMTEDQIDDLIFQIDTEGEGSINFVDFASIFGIRATPIDYNATGRAEKLNQLAEARGTFRTFDFDNSDSIDMVELNAIMLAMGKKLTDDQLHRMMASVDTDGSGEIDFQEFCQLLGIEWDDELGVDLKEIDAFSKANRPKDQKKKQSMIQDENVQVAVSPDEEHAPPGMTIVNDPTGFKFLKFAPNGHLVGICCNDGTVKIYEIKTNGKARRVCSLREHTHHALCMAWSPQSDRVVSVAADRMLHMWHVKTQTCVQSAKAHSAYVRAVDWSKDGSMIATCSSDKTVKLWNPITLEQSKLLLGHSNWVRLVRFRADSKRLVSGGDDSYMIVWSVPEGQILQRITGFTSSISDSCFLLRDEYSLPPLVTSSLNGQVSIWHPDVGLHGFMHYTIIGIEHLYPGPETMRRFIIFEIGRHRHSLKTKPVYGNSFDYEADTDKMMSCSVWDMNEVVRLQLFEAREGEHVKLMGEFKSTHKELLAHHSDGIQQVSHIIPLWCGNDH